MPLGGANPSAPTPVPLSYGRIPARVDVGLAMTGESARQRLAGVGMTPDGGVPFVTSMRSIAQDYVPVRFSITPGRGVNTRGAIQGAVNLSSEDYAGKRPTSQLKRRSKRRG